MGELAATRSSVEDYLLADKADATRLAYGSDFRHFSAWCRARGTLDVPASPGDVAQYLADLADAGRTVSTIVRRASAIRYAHKLKGFEPPTNSEGVKTLLRGIRRKLGCAPHQKAPATAKAISAITAKIPATLVGKRDRALLLLGFAAALRRSELVALNVADLERRNEGVIVHIRRSKTDQVGAGHQVAVPRGTKLRPVEAIEEWLAASKIVEGPVFRSIDKGGNLSAAPLTGASVALIVKRRCLAAGLDPSAFSGHSLRAGFVTSALDSGADVLKVMDVTRHSDVKTLKAYDRRSKAFRDHAGAKFL
jgi:site-specific recombinase XerD